uniref:BZIP domain-containing protein n=1 Tax=Ditylenchus dipsaci TaxID=166011 RepID=A0A915CYK3_9BILA
MAGASKRRRRDEKSYEVSDIRAREASRRRKAENREARARRRSKEKKEKRERSGLMKRGERRNIIAALLKMTGVGRKILSKVSLLGISNLQQSSSTCSARNSAISFLRFCGELQFQLVPRRELYNSIYDNKNRTCKIPEAAIAIPFYWKNTRWLSTARIWLSQEQTSSLVQL